MAIDGTLLNFLANNDEGDPRLLFKATMDVNGQGGTIQKKLFQYTMDSDSYVYDGDTYTPYPFQMEDFIRRLNDVSNPIEVLMWDAPEIDQPGTLKNLLEDTRILHRAIFTFILVFDDIVPGSNPAVKFSSDTKYEIILFKGRLNEPSATETTVNLGLVTQLNVLKDEVPSVTYSNTCPYTTGDKICIQNDKPEGGAGFLEANNDKVYTCSVDSTGLVVDLTGGIFLDNGIEINDFWNLGIIEFTEPSLEGTVRSVTDCVNNSTNYRLTLDDAVTPNLSSVTCVMRANCTRVFTDCKDRMRNEYNFGGMRSLIRVIGGSNIVGLREQ